MDKHREVLNNDFRNVKKPDRKSFFKPVKSIDNYGFRMGMFMLITAVVAIVLGALIANYVIMPKIIGAGKEITVPDISGVLLDDAKGILRRAGMEIRITDELYSDKVEVGYVISQTPLPNTRVKFNKTVEVVLSKGMEKSSVPIVKDLYLKDAVSLLEQAGFIVKDTMYTFSNEVTTNCAVNTQPPADVIMSKGSNVLLMISRGKKDDYIKVPYFVGMTPDSAKILAVSKKLVIGDINEQTGNVDRPTVIMQSPDSGIFVLKNDTIILTVQVPEL